MKIEEKTGKAMRKTKKYLRKISLIPILLAVLGLGFFAFSSEAQAATTYYVANNGSGLDCSSDVPCALTYGINKKAQSGDTVILQAGTYVQDMNISNAGITVQGTLDEDGNKLSIISPYADVSGSWVETATGSGIWKKALSHHRGLLIDIAGTKYKIPMICTTADQYCSGWLTNLLSKEDVAGNWDTGWAPDINFWDMFEVLAAQYNGETYIRFRDKAYPDTKGTIYAPTTALSNYGQSVWVDASGVTIKDLKIHAKHYGIHATANASNLTIDNNDLIYGGDKIVSTADNTTITNNLLKDNYYHLTFPNGDVYNRGAYSSLDAIDPRTGSHYSNYATGVRYGQYKLVRYNATGEQPRDESQGMTLTGDSPVVSNNTIDGVHMAIVAKGATNITVNNNTFSNIAATGLTLYTPSETESFIYNNVFNNVDNAIRFQDTQLSSGINIKIYGNKIYMPWGLGFGISWHYTTATHSGNSQTTWIYHNTIIGGQKTISHHAFSYAGGLENVYYVNNIFSGLQAMSSSGGYAVDKYGNPSTTIGGIWYNWTTGSLTGTWGTNLGQGGKDANNYFTGDTTLMWNPYTIAYAAVDWSAIDANAREGGIDISHDFTINGTTYPALPGFNPGYAGTDGKPDMGAVQTGDISDNSADVDNSGSVDSIDITLCVNVILGIEINAAIIQRAKAVATDVKVCDVLDLQAIVNEILK